MVVLRFFFSESLGGVIQDWRRDKERRVGTDDNTEQNGKDESTQNFTAKDEDDQQNNDGRKGCVERTAQGRIQGIVQYI